LSPINELNTRSREIFRQIVEAYFETGEPVGSRTLTRRLPFSLSSASIRNVMADLEDLGLLYAPHTSAGRLPTERGLKLFIDGLLRVGDLTAEERASIESQCAGAGRSIAEVLNEATEMLSGLTSTVSLVLAPKSEAPIRSVEFVDLSPGRALAIFVMQNGMVENRLIEVPAGMGAAAFQEATNYLNARLAGRTLEQARALISAELDAGQAELDERSRHVVEAGIGTWSSIGDDNILIVSGRSHLLEDVTTLAELERIRGLLDVLERKKTLLRVIDSARQGDGVHVFIGADSPLFDMAGCSMIVAPLGRNPDGAAAPRVVGAIGVIGPTRINYARIIPMVDYTARTINRLMG
jgi:heat-inducible transcriptional repressor